MLLFARYFHKNRALTSSFFIFLLNVFLSPSCHAEAGDMEGFFIVTGHIVNKKVPVGTNEAFLKNGVAFVNKQKPDFLIFTGDLIYGGKNVNHRFPVDLIEQQYDYVIQNVFSKINSKIYSAPGNHDTGWLPHPESIRFFEDKINSLQFSFEHKGSLFIILSLYQPFPHLSFMTLSQIFENYDTRSSDLFLKNLRNMCKKKYKHIFIFTQASPLSDYPVGYYWSNFIVPLLTNLHQNVYVFSTESPLRKDAAHGLDRFTKEKNIRFYSHADFPNGTYLVKFDPDTVNVELRQGAEFKPIKLREATYQETSRVSMIMERIRLEVYWTIFKIKYKYRQWKRSKEQQG